MAEILYGLVRATVCFPFTEPGLCTNTLQILNGQLEDREELFIELDKKKVNGIGIVDTTFNGGLVSKFGCLVHCRLNWDVLIVGLISPQ